MKYKEFNITVSSDKIIGSEISLESDLANIILPDKRQAKAIAVKVQVVGPDAKKLGVEVGDMVIPRVAHAFMIGGTEYVSTRASDVLAILKAEPPTEVKPEPESASAS